jgi:hypothetical protein
MNSIKPVRATPTVSFVIFSNISVSISSIRLILIYCFIHILQNKLLSSNKKLLVCRFANIFLNYDVKCTEVTYIVHLSLFLQKQADELKSKRAAKFEADKQAMIIKLRAEQSPQAAPKTL